MKITFLSLFLFTGCATTSLTSKIKHVDSIPSIDCVKRTIKNTPGVRLYYERKYDDHGVCFLGDCVKKSFWTDYLIEAYEHHPASTVITKRRSGRISIQNRFSLHHSKLPKNKERAIQLALDNVSDNIDRNCIHK